MTDHGPYQLLPDLSAPEFEALADDVRANGIRVPVDVDEDGAILDGHHRARVAAALGIAYPTRVLAGLSEREKRDHALAVNVHRRALTQAAKRDLIAESLKADPELSDRQHAARVGVSDHTIAAVRAELVTTAQIAQLSHRRGGDGRERPLPGQPSLRELSRNSRYRLKALVRAAEDHVGKDERPLDADLVARASDALDRVRRGDTGISAGFNEVAEHIGYAKVGRNGGTTNGATKLPAATRVAQIEALAESGHRADQIAQVLSIGTPRVRALARTHGITLPDARIGRRRRLDQDRIVEQTVLAVDAATAAIDLIDLSGVDPARVQEWATSLNASLAPLKKLAKTLKEMADDQA